MSIDPDLTFTQIEADIVIKDYVCAICHTDLVIQHIPNEGRVFIMCPVHNNVCLAGRVMRSTVSIQNEASVREYYLFISSLPDLYGSIWLNGIPLRSAQAISQASVCALCGSPLTIQGIYIKDENRMDKDHMSLVCRAGHGNVGLNGIGFITKWDYVFVPPVQWRKIARDRAVLSPPPPTTFIELPTACTVNKLGVIRFGNRLETGTSPDHLTVVFFGNQYAGLESKFKNLCGDKPARLNIRIPQAAMRESLECYNRGAMIARAVQDGSGWKWEYYRDPMDQEIQIRGGQALTLQGLELQRQGVDTGKVVYTTFKGDPVHMEQTLRLKVVIPELTEINGLPVIGYFDLSAAGRNAQNLSKGIEEVKAEALSKGMMLAEIPFVLVVAGNKDDGYMLKIETKQEK